MIKRSFVYGPTMAVALAIWGLFIIPSMVEQPAYAGTVVCANRQPNQPLICDARPQVGDTVIVRCKISQGHCNFTMTATQVTDTSIIGDVTKASGAGCKLKEVAAGSPTIVAYVSVTP